MTLDEQKAAARKAAFARRKEAHSGNTGSAAGML
ncbi:MAG: 5-formyltetrahydrofolate cyclo-ligase, partial [Rhodobacteraceae bacterium]|nr:5-formyltetrahydrofolate cyclo-ligase [Paracoccaceae bacterium]